LKRYSAPEEARQQTLDAFPPGTGELVYEISRSVSILHMNWKDYRTLYGTSPERIELLNWAASTFFGLLDSILFNNIVLAIARLTDRAQTGSYTNASLERLVEALEPDLDAAMVDSLHKKLDKLTTFCKPIRERRNKALAHADLDTTLDYRSDPLPGISRADIEEALKQIRAFLNVIHVHFRKSAVGYEYVSFPFGGEDLIFHLENAQKYRENQDQEFRKKYGIKTDDS
jgi:hypothetical protein